MAFNYLVPFALRRYVFALGLPFFFVALFSLLEHGLHSLPALRKDCQSTVAFVWNRTLLAFGDELEGEIEVMLCEPVVVGVALGA